MACRQRRWSPCSPVTADRVVLDASVSISGVLTQTGPPRRVLDLVRADSGFLLFSDERPPSFAIGSSARGSTARWVGNPG